MANENKGETAKPATPNPDEVMVTMTKSELQKLVEDTALTILETRLKASTGGLDLNKLGEIIGNAVADGMRKNTRPKVTVGEYIKRGYSVFHPNGPGPALARKCYQNDIPLDAAKLHDNEIALLNQITHGGRYIDRLVEVVMVPDGVDDAVCIRFNNRTPQQAIELKGKVRNFEDMLQQIVADQKKEDEEAQVQEEMKREQRKQFFASRATRDARAKAGVEA